MQVVWEADTAAFASRKRAARACIACQKKKKRCQHTFTRPPDQQAESDGLEKVLPNLTHKEPIRFIGDLNPESILTELSSRSKGSDRVISRIGTWVEQPEARTDDQLLIQYAEPPSAKNGEKLPVNVEKYGKSDGGRRTLTTHHRNYLQAVGAFRVLPKTTQTAMVATYIACIDSLLPILDGSKLLQEYTSGDASIFLIQAICLVTCKISELSQFLRLYEDGPLLDPIPFARSLHIGLDAAMKADMEPDRVTRVQILTLMHLHNDGPGGIEESSLHLSQAIHDAWTAGLHIQTPGRTTSDEASLLWWSIWTLDRINACIGGRPLMIADRDIDLGRPPLHINSRAPITIWIRLGDLLDQVIESYRPTADPDTPGWEGEWPTFESLLEGIGSNIACANLDNNTVKAHRTILELCYNVIGILACRNASPSHPSYNRRISSANRIEWLMSQPNPAHPDTPTPSAISPLPLVPYAIGLSLTVVYRGLRDQSLDHSSTFAALSTRCGMLESLSNRWWTADAMAKLGRKALKSMQHPVGLKRQEVIDMENAMEAEVTVCKYGPFEGNKQQDDCGATSGNGSGLHLLSDAAAAHSLSHSQPQPLHQMTPGSYTQSNSKTIAHPAGSYRRTSTPPTEPIPTPPQPLHQHASADNDTINVATVNTDEMDPAVFEKFDVGFTSFNELDGLFDGFFDLSMPTVTFEDPMFDLGMYDINIDGFGSAGIENGTMNGTGEGRNGGNTGAMDTETQEAEVAAQGSGGRETSMIEAVTANQVNGLTANESAVGNAGHASTNSNDLSNVNTKFSMTGVQRQSQSLYPELS